MTPPGNQRWAVSPAREQIRALVCDLPRSIREKRLLAMLRAYIDDSGSSPVDRVFVLGGLIGEAGQWEGFCDEWVKVLNKDPAIRYFKSFEARNFKGEFAAGWNRPLVDQRVDDLCRVASGGYARYRVHAIMRWEDFNKFIGDIGGRVIDKFHAAYTNPYMLCFFAIVMRTRAYLNARGIQDEVDYIFDEQGVYGEFASQVMALLQNPAIRRLLDNPPIFRDDKKVLPLQAADMYAWNVREFCVRGNGSDPYPNVKYALGKLPPIEIILDERYLLPVRETLLDSMQRAPQFLKDWSKE